MTTNKLTKSENLVAKTAIEGFNNKEIAEKLCISTHTVKAHLAKAYIKLGVKNRVQLAIKLLTEN